MHLSEHFSFVLLKVSRSHLYWYLVFVEQQILTFITCLHDLSDWFFKAIFFKVLKLVVVIVRHFHSCVCVFVGVVIFYICLHKTWMIFFLILSLLFKVFPFLIFCYHRFKAVSGPKNNLKIKIDYNKNFGLRRIICFHLS